VAALVTAVSPAGVSGFFGIVGMMAIFAAAAIPIMVMVGVLEAVRLITALLVLVLDPLAVLLTLAAARFAQNDSITQPSWPP
jgi:hypothetical protein